jgi:phthalate 4,5-cis-dihydrodiol dehydrogenase
MTVARRSVGVGIIGAGSFGERHAEAIARAGGFELVGACREKPDGLDAFVAVHGGRAFRDMAELLADPAVEAVVIAVPHDVHEAAAVAAARAGKAILLEKPMAPTLAACRRIDAAVRAAGVPLMVGHTQRFAASMVAAKGLLDSGRLGKVRFGMSAMVKLWMEPNRRTWHLRTDSGGGMLMTAGIHALDRLLWLVGTPVHSVAAVGGAVFHRQESDDSMMLLLRFADGAAASVASIAYRDGAPFGGTELVCDEGVLVLDPAGEARLGQGAAWRTLDLPPSSDRVGDALVEEWRAFGRLVREGGPNPVDAASASATIACIVAALESARTGREVVVGGEG